MATSLDPSSQELAGLFKVRPNFQASSFSRDEANFVSYVVAND